MPDHIRANFHDKVRLIEPTQYEINLIRADGGLQIEFNGQQNKISDGDIVLVSRGFTANCPGRDDVGIDIIGFMATELGQARKLASKLYYLLDINKDADAFVSNLFNLFLATQFHKDTRPIRIDRLFNAMRSSILELVAVDHLAGRLTEGEILTYRRAANLIQDRISNAALSSSMIATEMRISQRRLSTIFLKATGGTVAEAIRTQRVERAKEMLRDSTVKLQVATIAETCGFNDQSYFSKIFRIETGFTPLKFASQAICPSP